MNGYEIFRRLEAYEAGRPVPVGARLNVPVAADTDLLTIAFVRMGGESAPWGIGFRRGRRAPRFLTAPEPRNRDLVASMVLDFAPTLVEFLEPAERHRQLWLPNASHVEMLHMLAFAYQNTRFGEESRRIQLNALGRACNWLFREANRPGELRVLDVVSALRKAYAFPADDLRQQHPGFLLAWLTTRGNREVRHRQASEIERLSASTSLDPTFERETLEPIVSGFNEARTDGSSRAQREAAKVIHDKLVPELERRLRWIDEAIETLRHDRRRENEGLASLIQVSQIEHAREYLAIEQKIQRGERAFVPSPETDHHPAAAAARFLRQQQTGEFAESALLVNDEELQARAIAEGDAFRGRISDVRDEGVGRATIPVWIIEDDVDLPLRIRAGGRLCVATHPARWGTVRAVGTSAGGGRRIELEIRGHKTNRSGDLAANSARLRGSTVLLLPTDGSSLADRKIAKVWGRDTPGAWIVQPKARRPAPQNVQDDE